jgi:hypothetical protein
MSKYRNALPQLNGDLFLTDGGMAAACLPLFQIAA